MLRILALIALLAAQTVAVGQTLSPGTVSGNVYTNTDLGITYSFPSGWTVAPKVERGVLDVRFTPQKLDGREVEMFVLDTSLFPEKTSLYMSRTTDVGATYTLEGGIQSVKLGSNEFMRTDWIRKVGQNHLYNSRLSAEANGWRLILFMTAPKRADVDRQISPLSTLRFQPPHPTQGPPGPVFQSMMKKVVSGKLQQSEGPEAPHRGTSAAIHHPVLSPVLLQAVIGTDGKVKDLKPVGGDSKFFPAAMDMVRQWEYQPYVVDGKPIEVYTAITVYFFIERP